MMISNVNFITGVIGIVCCVLFSSPTDGNTCHETHPDKLNIHLIPHTHDDVGWLKTVDQYYYGSNKIHAPFGVQYILDSVISELGKNPDRRFVYVETAYFWRWWEELDENGRESVRKLVSDGRLEFLLGGWCMSDEATPHYSAMIDQMTLGLRFLNDTFGVHGRPNVAWQIDPFGHSSELGIEFAEMGYNGLFLGRIDYEDHTNRMKTKTMEHIWRPDPTLGEAGDLFVSVLFNMYTAPEGFCFDIIYCQDEPIMDNRKLHGYNVDQKIRMFESQMKEYQRAYKTNHILVTMGQDFTYTAASSWFKNIDKLIKHTNKLGNLNLLYSTPRCYLEALNAQNVSWKVKEADDFFPYGSDEHSYWTGYFTSRPAIKYLVYLTNNILQATKQMAILLGDKLEEEEFVFKKSVAIAQHHDGVSGTEKQHVTDDYALYLNEGLHAGEKILNEVYRSLYGSDYPEHSFGNLRNISQLEVSESGQNFVITVYNPLASGKSIPIKFPALITKNYQIFDQNGTSIEYDRIPIPAGLTNVPGRNSNATEDVTFIAKHLPAMGVTNYYVQAAPPVDKNENLTRKIPTNGSDVVLDNGKIQLVFKRGILQSVIKNKVVHPFNQNFYTYVPYRGFNSNPETRASGAYIFRPTTTSPEAFFNIAYITQYEGKNVYEVHQRFSGWLSQVVRLYKDSEDIEFEWLVGPLPLIDFNGIELVTKYKTNIASNSTFYTDSNGRRWVKRIRNYRKSWNTTITEPVASNYYPLTTSIKIEDQTNQLSVIVDRPEGGTSMQDGEVEIMLHRRLLYDDDKGVVEPLDERAFGYGLVIRGKHVVQFKENGEAAVNAHRFKTLETVYHPVAMFAKTNYKLDEWKVNFNKNISLLTSELPANVHVLTLERWREGQILLRLEHIFQINEASSYANKVNVNIKKLLRPLEVTHYEELTLAANLEKRNLRRMKWNSESKAEGSAESRDYLSDDKITLQPMQIRTFLLYIKHFKN